MKKSFILVSVLFIGIMLLISQSGLAGAAIKQAGNINIIPTFECISIYFPTVQKGNCQVFYKSTAEIWQACQ